MRARCGEGQPANGNHRVHAVSGKAVQFNPELLRNSSPPISREVRLRNYSIIQAISTSTVGEPFGALIRPALMQNQVRHRASVLVAPERDGRFDRR